MLRPLLVSARAGGVSGLWLGLLLAVLTAARNDFHTAGDFLRIAAALAAVFGLLLGAAGLLVGLPLLVLSRRRPVAAGELAFSAVAATTAGIWTLRWFEFLLAYPAKWPLVDGFAGMLVVALAFLIVTAAAAALLGRLLARVAAALGRSGATAPRCAAAAGVAALVAAGVVGLRSPRAEPVPVPSPPALAPNDRRVLLVGCDGADWSVLDRLMAEGELPHLRRLVESGVRAPLATIRDRPSPALWTAIASSRRPEDTGIRDFYRQHVLGASAPVQEFPRLFGLNRGLLLLDVLGRAAVRVTPVNSTMVRTRTLWSILGEAGVRVGVVGWLVSWPANADGAAFLVSDQAWLDARDARDAGDAPDAGPPERALWDPPAIGALLPADDAAWETEDAFTAAVAERLCREFGPQVLIAYFRDVDSAEHRSWNEWEPHRFRGGAGRSPYGGPVREAVLRFDRALGLLMKEMGEDTTVIVVSDHGHRAWFTWFGRGPSGGHTDSPDGVFLAAGPGIRAGVPDERPSVYDVTPTVLRLLGLPTAADMEGRPLREILVDDAPLPGIDSWERQRGSQDVLAEEDDETIERLRALGYVR